MPGRDDQVLFRRVPAYREEALNRAVGELLDELELGSLSGARILVKPNWVSFRQAELACTHPLVVRAACLWLLDQGAQVAVGDSPAFGTASRVARASGAAEALSGLPVRLVRFHAVPFTLPCGVKVGLAREALESDGILNLPRLKVHDQLLLTLAVKNLFGTVVGLTKPLLHARLGDRGDLFARVLLEVALSLPVRANLVDAVVAMEGRGPTGGRPRKTGLVVAARDALALDVALYRSLGLSPEEVPLWRTAQGMGLSPSPPPLPVPLRLALPDRLSPVTFHPLRLLKGLLKRAWLRLRGQVGA